MSRATLIGVGSALLVVVLVGAEFPAHAIDDVLADAGPIALLAALIPATMWIGSRKSPGRRLASVVRAMSTTSPVLGGIFGTLMLLGGLAALLGVGGGTANPGPEITCVVCAGIAVWCVGNSGGSRRGLGLGCETADPPVIRLGRRPEPGSRSARAA